MNSSLGNTHLTYRVVGAIGLSFWAGIELDVALICACMPSVYPLFIRLVHLCRREPTPSDPVPRAIVTIGGSCEKNSKRFKKHGLWSTDTTELTITGSQEEVVEIPEALTRQERLSGLPDITPIEQDLHGRQQKQLSDDNEAESGDEWLSQVR